MESSTEQFHSSSLGFIEELYAEFLRDPHSVDPEWQRYFGDMERDQAAARNFQIGPSFDPGSLFNPGGSSRNGNGHGNGHAALSGPNGAQQSNALRDARSMNVANLQDRVDQLIRAYRVRGHMIAKLDPLGLPRPTPPELGIDFYGLTEADLDRTFSTRTIYGPDMLPLRGILDRLRNTYCRSIGVQFMHIDDMKIRNWLQHRMEGTENRINLSKTEQLRIFTRLTDATILEEFIHKKFTGVKRFSLEGAESLIPLLDLTIEKAGESGVAEVVLAMAHRGRLNVLANIMGKSPRLIFREFEDAAPEFHTGGGDVKYHMGYSNDWTTASGKKVHMSLCFNPSHLEFINPVAMGRMRAKQDRMRDYEHRRGLVVLIHGDAAFAGEGVIQETLNLCSLNAYSVGGTIHVIVNNQIGFTTLPEQARSTPYCSDVAKMLQAPIFHVNGEDPEAVATVMQLALDFRQEFQRDIVIDMYCYRLYGHNEGDEPAFTQPLLYQAIEKRKNIRESYLEHLLKLGDITREEADKIAAQRRANLEQDLSVARSEAFKPRPEVVNNVWKQYLGGRDRDIEEVDTGTSKSRLVHLMETICKVPTDFHPHAKIEKLLKQRLEMAHGTRKFDWGAAELLAYATLLTEGHRVRITGQDCERGTFSHRHAVLHDVRDGKSFLSLRHLAPDQKPIEMQNSPLSEVAVLGYEYGYSLDYPDALVMWEAQFGDFVNVAQVIIDQFIASAEEKWRRLSGIVMLLPHGFEGAGPEHSSARLERFLELSANDNIQVAVPTTPAQMFHLLRRQVLRRARKPLIVMTPKYLLRREESALEDFATGRFQRLIDDDRQQRTVNRVLLCSGKVYYDLLDQRQSMQRDDISIVRIELLAPLPEEELRHALAKYPDGTPVVWVQEEPENMGAWRYLRVKLGEKIFGRLPFSGVYRRASASPATGSSTGHKREQKELLAKAFGGK